MGKQDPRAGRNWYVLHTYSGYEDSVQQALEQRVESLGMQDYIFTVMVPVEKLFQNKENHGAGNQ